MRTEPTTSVLGLGLGLVALLTAAGCRNEGAAGQAASGPEPGPPAAGAGDSGTKPEGSVHSGVVVSVPLPPAQVAKVVNPKGLAPYAGPTGTLRGKVRIEGDPAPDVSVVVPQGKCPEGASAYGKLFRATPEGELADALVAVTRYEGYVPPADPAKKVGIRGCAFLRQTVAATFGQTIEVSNLDKIESYIPYLDGAPSRAMLVAVPGGDSVKLYPLEPGRYTLRDQLPKPFMTSDVYVLAYATHDVSGLDGTYEIPGIPVGEVRVSAFLRAIDAVVEADLKITPGDNVHDLTLRFAKSDAPAPAASGSGAPSAGAPASAPPVSP